MNHFSIISTLDDITEHSLTYKKATDEYLLKMSGFLTNSLNLEDFVIYLSRNSRKKLKQHIKVDKDKGPRIPMNSFTIEVGKGIVGSSAKSKEAILIDDTSKNKIYISEDKFRYSELVVPIILNNTVVGVLDSEHSDKCFYSDDILHVFGITAKFISYFFNESKFKNRENLEKKHFQYFKLLLEQNKIYLNEHLSSADIAHKLDISPAYFSHLVNKISGRSFNSIVNAYRINHIIELLYQQEHKHRSLLAIAFSSGFNSKSSFNVNFKKVTSKTPSQFLAEMC